MATLAKSVSEWETSRFVLGQHGAVPIPVGAVDVTGLEAALERTAACKRGDLASVPDIGLVAHPDRHGPRYRRSVSHFCPTNDANAGACNLVRARTEQGERERARDSGEPYRNTSWVPPLLSSAAPSHEREVRANAWDILTRKPERAALLPWVALAVLPLVGALTYATTVAVAYALHDARPSAPAGEARGYPS